MGFAAYGIYSVDGPQVVSIVLLSNCDVIFEARIGRKSGTFDIFYVNRGWDI